MPDSGERFMRICVFGAGAIGGNFAARLANAGNEVSVLARGKHLEAIRAKGLVLIAGDKKIVAKVRASDRPADLGPQDAVISTLKATGLGVLAEGVGPLLGPETPWCSRRTASPWWYGHGLGKSGLPTSSRPRTSSAMRRVVKIKPSCSISMVQMRSRVLIARRPIATML
jgi:2-dehydropantoate 2-reductase